MFYRHYSEAYRESAESKDARALFLLGEQCATAYAKYQMTRDTASRAAYEAICAIYEAAEIAHDIKYDRL